MKTGGGQELAYANTALQTALIDRLVENGTLAEGDRSKISEDAIKLLKPLEHLVAVAGAMRYINE
jgi:hypothetical protein